MGAEHLYGFSERDAVGRVSHELLKTIFPQPWTKIRAELLEKRAWQGDLRHHARDGREIIVSARLQLVRDAAGAERVLEVNRDITEQRRAEEALRESEAQFRMLANAIPTLCWMANADGWITWYNERWYEYTGTTPEQMEGWGWQSVHDPEALPGVLERWKESIAEEKPFEMVFPLRGADGVFRPFLTRIVPVRGQDGEVAQWFGTNTDITEQRRREEALRQSEERLRLAQQAAGVGTFEWNLQTGVNTWTPELEHLYGLPPGDFMRTQPAWESLVHPEDRAKAIARVQEAFDTGQPGGAEWRVVWPDGSIHWLAGRWQVFKDDSGIPLRLTGANIDITERKRLEDQFRQAQKLESIGRLAGGVAHDFNNLLTVISGYAQMVLDELAAQHPWREPMGELAKAAASATGLTRQLLAFSRQQVSEPKTLVLNDVVRDLEKMLRRLISEDIELAFVLDPDAGFIRADPGHIEQVIMNLAVNARDAMPQGGRLLIETSRQVVDEHFADRHLAVAPGTYVMLCVSDTGVGMSEEVKAHIFEPFFTTKEQGKATGLGLSTVYGIVKQSEGAIWVYSEPGQGTTFRMMFPATREEPKPAAAPRAEEAPGGTETILVAEDEPGLRAFVRDVLTRHGYTVLEAANGRDALALARHHGTIHLLLTDIVMPGMGGLELAEQFGHEHPHAPVLMMSGYAEHLKEPSDRATNYIQKPFTSAALLSRIRLLFESRREHRKGMET